MNGLGICFGTVSRKSVHVLDSTECCTYHYGVLPSSLCACLLTIACESSLWEGAEEGNCLRCLSTGLQEVCVIGSSSCRSCSLPVMHIILLLHSLITRTHSVEKWSFVWKIDHICCLIFTNFCCLFCFESLKSLGISFWQMKLNMIKIVLYVCLINSSALTLPPTFLVYLFVFQYVVTSFFITFVSWKVQLDIVLEVEDMFVVHQPLEFSWRNPINSWAVTPSTVSDSGISA